MRARLRFLSLARHRGGPSAVSRSLAHSLFRRHIGSFVNEEDAARAVDAAFAERGRPVVNAAVLSGAREHPPKQGGSSAYSGVAYVKKKRKWRAEFTHKTKKMYVTLRRASASTPISPPLAALSEFFATSPTQRRPLTMLVPSLACRGSMRSSSPKPLPSSRHEPPIPLGRRSVSVPLPPRPQPPRSTSSTEAAPVPLPRRPGRRRSAARWSSAPDRGRRSCVPERPFRSVPTQARRTRPLPRRRLGWRSCPRWPTPAVDYRRRVCKGPAVVAVVEAVRSALATSCGAATPRRRRGPLRSALAPPTTTGAAQTNKKRRRRPLRGGHECPRWPPAGRPLLRLAICGAARGRRFRTVRIGISRSTVRGRSPRLRRRPAGRSTPTVGRGRKRRAPPLRSPF